MARSFWEKLGRSVGHGLKKAREVGEAVGERAEKRLDLVELRRELRGAHERLGEQVAAALLEPDGSVRDASGVLASAPVAEALETVAELEREIRRLEAGGGEEAQGTQEDAPGARGETPEPPPAGAGGREG